MTSRNKLSEMIRTQVRHRWIDHFIWSKDARSMVGLTAIGRATVIALDLNRDRVMVIRGADWEVDRHPPVDDPIQE